LQLILAITKLIHLVAGKEHSPAGAWTPEKKSGYATLIEWLAQHGESLDQARADQKRWHSWSQTTGEFSRKMDAEVAERKAREARQQVGTAKSKKSDGIRKDGGPSQ
jgi:hypothetical protein